MNNHPAGPKLNLAYRSVTSNDAYEQAQELGIWSHLYTQLSAGKFNGSLEEIVFESNIIFKETLNQSVLQTGISDSDTITFGFISELVGNACCNGEIFDKPTVLAICPSQELEFRSPLRHNIYAANVNFYEFEQYINKIEHLDIFEFLAQLKVVSRNNNVANKLVSIFNYANFIANEVMTEKQLNFALKDIKNILFQCLVDCCNDEKVTDTLKIKPNRLRIFHQTDAFIREYAKEPIDIITLCEVSCTSRRTLQYCFETVIGIAPLAYIRCVRLSGVRQEIKEKKDKSISEIATGWGFWHLSNFSTQYKQMFGELPSKRG